jgi:hypothetical protein
MLIAIIILVPLSYTLLICLFLVGSLASFWSGTHTWFGIKPKFPVSLFSAVAGACLGAFEAHALLDFDRQCASYFEYKQIFGTLKQVLSCFSILTNSIGYCTLIVSFYPSRLDFWLRFINPIPTPRWTQEFCTTR